MPLSWDTLSRPTFAHKTSLDALSRELKQNKYREIKGNTKSVAEFGELVLHNPYEATIFMSGDTSDNTLSKGLGVMVHTLLAAFPDQAHLSPTAASSYWTTGGTSKTTAVARLAGGFPDIAIAMQKAIKRTLDATMKSHSLVEIEVTTPTVVFDTVDYNCKPDAIFKDGGKTYVVDYKTHWTPNADTTQYPESGAIKQALFNANIHKTHAIIVDAWPSGASEENSFVASQIKVCVTKFELK